MIEIQILKITSLQRTCEMQSRVTINQRIVQQYAEEMRNGAQFPAVVVYVDGSNHWLADGFHRIEATIIIGAEFITAEIRKGTARDALLYAVGANADHGLRRTRGDKRRSVSMLLTDNEWRQWSDRSIAKKCSVSDRFVSTLRKTLSTNGRSVERLAERNGTTYSMNTTRIGTDRILEDNPDQSGDSVDGEKSGKFPTGEIQVATSTSLSGLKDWNWIPVTQSVLADGSHQAVLIIIPGTVPVSKRLKAFLRKVGKLNGPVFVTAGLRGLM